MSDRVTEQARRVAENDVTFRKANERVREAAQEHALTDSLVPFICECAEETCTQIVRMTLAEYEALRSQTARFVNLPGHETAAQGWATVVGRTDRYVVVEKVGEARDVAIELDPTQ